MIPFQVQTNRKFIFGVGRREELTSLAADFDPGPVLVLTGRTLASSPMGKDLLQSLGKERKVIHRTVSGEPSPAGVDPLAEEARREKVVLVIGVGGGSVIDAAKAASAMACEEGSVKDFLEGVGEKAPSGRKLPLIALPTTSGTGSEATKNAVITDRSEGYKKSLRHDNYIPDIALIDPELTLSCPPEVTKACGLDAYCQLVESYFSTQASDFTDMLAFEGMVRINRSFMGVCSDRADNLDARSDMAYASYLSGITLANAGLGTVHGLGGPLGGLFDIPHGVACGLLLRPVMEITFRKLAVKWQTLVWESKIRRVAALLTGRKIKNFDEAVDVFLKQLDQWLSELNLKPLGHYGVTEEDLGKIIRASGNKNNPYQLTAEEREQVLLSVR